MMTATTTVKTIVRTEVSFWWHGFFVREGFYYGELLTKNEQSGELEYTHFVTNGNVHDKKLSVYFHVGIPKQTQKWVYVGEQKRPRGVLGRAYWKKRSAYEAVDRLVNDDVYYSILTTYGRLFYSDPVDAWCVYDGEVMGNGFAILTEHHSDHSIILASHGTEV